MLVEVGSECVLQPCLLDPERGDGVLCRLADDLVGCGDAVQVKASFPHEQAKLALVGAIGPVDGPAELRDMVFGSTVRS